MAECAAPEPETPYLREVRLADFIPQDWDAEAEQAGGSLRSAHVHLSTLGLRTPFARAPRTFVVLAKFAGEPKRIGHFTLVHSRDASGFYDGLCLKPDHAGCWAEAMAAALRLCGPGRFEYGWEWSLEPRREQQLGAIAGVEISLVRPSTVHAIDFARWPSWDDYRRATSENVRRNARRASAYIDALTVTFDAGLAALPHIRELAALRRELSRRKGLSYRPVRAALGYLGSIITMPRQAMIARVTGGGRTLAAYRYAEFGALTYFRDGAAVPDPGGAAWFLMLAMLQRAYDRAPQGKFVMGYTDRQPGRGDPAVGLLRSRRSVRVSDWPTSVVRFRWSPPAGTRAPG